MRSASVRCLRPEPAVSEPHLPGVAADRVSRIVLGLHAAALAGVHGAFTLLQGPVGTPGAPFSAIGPPCEPALVWHACLPALTLAPDLRTAGILTLATAGLTALAALVLTGGRAAAALGATAIALLLVGGGFVLVVTAAAAALTLPPRARAEGAAARRLARAWPWALAGLVAWGLGGWWLGTAANDVLLGFGGATFLLDLTLPFAVAVTARARSAPPP